MEHARGRGRTRPPTGALLGRNLTSRHPIATRYHLWVSYCSDVVQNHLLALRWMNPNAVVYLREERGQGTPVIEYELCECRGTQLGAGP